MIKDYIKIETITSTLKQQYNVTLEQDEQDKILYALTNNQWSESNCITDSENVVAMIVGEEYFSYQATIQDFNIDSQRDALLSAINESESTSETNGSIESEGHTGNNGTSQFYVQNNTEDSDGEWNSNKFRNNATDTENNIDTNGTSLNNSKNSQKGKTTYTAAKIKYVRELRNLNIFAAAQWKNFIRSVMMRLVMPFETEGETKNSLPWMMHYGE